jgi:hypothetical protein
MTPNEKGQQFNAAKAKMIAALAGIAKQALDGPMIDESVSAACIEPIFEARALFESAGFTAAGALVNEICVEAKNLSEAAHDEVWWGRDGALEGLAEGTPEREQVLQHQRQLYRDVYSKWLVRDCIKWSGAIERLTDPK